MWPIDILLSVYKKLGSAGTKDMNDLIHESGEFLSQDEFEHTYDIKLISFNF